MSDQSSFAQDSSFWVDYVEGELDSALQQDLDLLLAHSQIDREIVEGIQKTKQTLKENGDHELPMNESYYQELHHRIMSQVNATPERKRTRFKRALKKTFQDYIPFGES